MSIPYPAGEPLTCRQIRELDILAIEHVGIPGLVLMENAARAVAECVYRHLLDPARSRVLVLCGGGNNGGDGLAAARHLRNAGVEVCVALSSPRDRVSDDAAVNLGIWDRMGGRLLDATCPEGLDAARAEAGVANVILDALLGTGATGAPRGAAAELIRIANAAPRAGRVAVDIPSGFDGDAGRAFDPCFRAHATVTFVAAKIGFTAPGASEYVGRVIVADIGVPRELIPGRKNVGGGG